MDNIGDFTVGDNEVMSCGCQYSKDGLGIWLCMYHQGMDDGLDRWLEKINSWTSTVPGLDPWLEKINSWLSTIPSNEEYSKLDLDDLVN